MRPRRQSLHDTLVRPAVLVELAAIVTLLVGFQLYRIAVDAALDPFFLDSDTRMLVIQGGLGVVGAAALVVGYAAWHGSSLPLSMPDRDDTRLVGGAVVATALLATLPFIAPSLQMEIGLDHVVTALGDLGSVFSGRSLLRIGLFVPAMVLLYHGLIQRAFRRLFDRAAAATTLFGGYLVAPTVVTYGTFPNGPWLSIWGRRGAVALLFVAALGVAVYAARGSDDGSNGTLSTLPVLAALALATVVLAADTGSLSGALVVLTRAGVIGVAAYAYEATESLAVPVVVYTAYAGVASVLYVASLAAAFGG